MHTAYGVYHHHLGFLTDESWFGTAMQSNLICDEGNLVETSNPSNLWYTYSVYVLVGILLRSEYSDRSSASMNWRPKQKCGATVYSYGAASPKGTSVIHGSS